MKMKRVIETIAITKEPYNAVLVLASQKETCNAVPHQLVRKSLHLSYLCQHQSDTSSEICAQIYLP